MRRAWLLLLLAGCTHTPAARPPLAPAAPVEPKPAPAPPPPCPAEAPPYDLAAADPITPGERVEQVCLLGKLDPAHRTAVEVVLEQLAPTAYEPAKVRVQLELIASFGWVEDVVVVRPEKEHALWWIIKERPRVAEVKLEGVKFFGTGAMNQSLGSLDEVSPASLSRWTREWESTYAARGYPAAKISTATESLGPDEVRLRVKVDEGAAHEVHDIQFVGNKRAPGRELLPLLVLKKGAPWDPAALERDALRVVSEYYDRGMINATVNAKAPKLGAAKNGVVPVTAVLEVNEGDVFKLGQISITGFQLGDEAQTRAVLKSKPGAVFNRSLLAKDLKALEQRGLSRGAEVTVLPLTTVNGKSIDVELKVEFVKNTQGVVF